MLAEKWITKKHLPTEKSFIQRLEDKVDHFDVESLMENLSDWMFKIILIVGIPYFIIIYAKFMMIQ